MSLSQEHLRALAGEYRDQCEEISRLVLHAHSLLGRKDGKAFLLFCRQHPHLARMCDVLDMQGRADWITITDFLGCQPPPELPLKEASAIRRAYGEWQARRKKRGTDAGDKNAAGGDFTAEGAQEAGDFMEGADISVTDDLFTPADDEPLRESNAPRLADDEPGVPEEIPETEPAESVPHPVIPPPVPQRMEDVRLSLAERTPALTETPPALAENVLSLYEKDGARIPSPEKAPKLAGKMPVVNTLETASLSLGVEMPVIGTAGRPPGEMLEILPESALPEAPPLPVTPPSFSVTPPSSPVLPPLTLPVTPPELPAARPVFPVMPPVTPPSPPVTPPSLPVFPPTVPEGLKPAENEKPPELPKHEENAEKAANSPHTSEKRPKSKRARRKTRAMLLGLLMMTCLLAGGGVFYCESHGIPVFRWCYNAITGRVEPVQENPPVQNPQTADVTDEFSEDDAQRLFALRGADEGSTSRAGVKETRELIIPDTEEGRQTRQRYEAAGKLVAEMPRVAAYGNMEYFELSEATQRFFRELWPYRDLMELTPVTYAKNYSFIYEYQNKRWLLRHENERSLAFRGDSLSWTEAGLQLFRHSQNAYPLYLTGVQVQTKAGPGLNQRKAIFSLFPEMKSTGGEKPELAADETSAFRFTCPCLSAALALRDEAAKLRVTCVLTDISDTTVVAFTEDAAMKNNADATELSAMTPMKMTLTYPLRPAPEMQRVYEIRCALRISPAELTVEITPTENAEAFSQKFIPACRAELDRLLETLRESLSAAPAEKNMEKYAQDARDMLENIAAVTEKQVRDTQNRWLQDELPEKSVKIMDEIVALLAHRQTLSRKTFPFQMEVHAVRDGAGGQIPVLELK